MHKNSLMAVVIGAAALVSATNGAFAKDWIEKVELSRDGIDVKQIEVGANKNGYTGITTNAHRFLLKLYARATNGERIVAMKLGSYNGVLYFEGSGNLWNKSYAHRDVGAGTKRTVTINDTPTIPLSKISWYGSDPVKRCELKMQTEMNKGKSKAWVLSQEWTTAAYAHFELDAVAAHKNKAENNNWNIGNTTDQRAGYNYELTVKCNAGMSLTPSNVKAPEEPKKPGILAPATPKPPRAKIGG
jgi:hypothetical protein